MALWYRIGEGVKNLGIGQYTLKHYERSGLIEPQVDAESGYRYYDYRDFGKLIIVRELRKLGFSVEEVVELIGANADCTTSLYRERIKKNKQEIARLTEANELLGRRLSLIEAWSSKLGSWERAAMPPIAFHPHFSTQAEGERVDGAAQGSREWKDAYERGLIAVRIPLETLGGVSDALEWGFVAIESVSLPGHEGGHPHELKAKGSALPQSASAIVTYAQLRREDNQAISLRRLAKNALDEAGCEASADAYAVVGDVQASKGETNLLVAVFTPVGC